VKGLPNLPSRKDLLQAYNEIQERRSPLPLKDLALYSQWARLDPRLAEILVEHLALCWSKIPVGEFIDTLLEQPWPRAALVLFRFAELIVPTKKRRILKGFISAIEDSLEPSPPQLFFIHLQRPNSTVQKNEVEFRTSPYSLSGFIGSQSLLSRSRWPTNKTSLTKDPRRYILKTLLNSKTDVCVDDYISACRGLISRRQAQRDLSRFATSKGYTRNRRYHGLIK
jgi:hypothetical protein